MLNRESRGGWQRSLPLPDDRRASARRVHFQVSIAAKTLGFQIRLVKRAGCMFSAADQTPTASVENGNKDQIPLHSMIGLNDGFT